MLQTIEVEIDSDGRVHPLEPLPWIPSGRGYLTMLTTPASGKVHASAGQALRLLASERFRRRPAADSEEVRERIAALRNDWGGQ